MTVPSAGAASSAAETYAVHANATAAHTRKGDTSCQARSMYWAQMHNAVKLGQHTGRACRNAAGRLY